MTRSDLPTLSACVLFGTVLLACGLASAARGADLPDVEIIGPIGDSTVNIGPKPGKLAVYLRLHNGFYPYATSISYDGGSTFEHVRKYKFNPRTKIYTAEFPVPTGTTKDVRINVRAVKPGNPGVTPALYADGQVTGITTVRP